MPDAENESVTAETVRVRRTPRYGRFMLIGALVFAIAAFIVTYSLPQGQGYDRNTVFGLVLVVAVAVGVALGGVVAIVLNAVANRRARTVTADRVVVAPSRADDPADPVADDKQQ
jgi:hypothetical protein